MFVLIETQRFVSWFQGISRLSGFSRIIRFFPGLSGLSGIIRFSEKMRSKILLIKTFVSDLPSSSSFFLYSGRGKKTNFPVRFERSHNFQGTVRHVVPTLKPAASRIWAMRKSWNYATSGIHVRFSAKGWIRISTNFGLRPAAPPRVSSSRRKNMVLV